MNFKTMANVIRTRFVEQVIGESELPVAYDNAPFNTPDAGMWVRFSILFGDSTQASLGANKRYRNVGVSVAQIFCPMSQGDADALELADKIKATFRSVTDGGVTFKTPSLRRVGRTGKLYQINVSCPFYADEIEGA